MSTSTAPTASPRPTLPIGVAFATVTSAEATPKATKVEASTSEIPPTETPAPTPSTYIVQNGDTLVGIATARGIGLDQLLALNPDIRPEFLLVGQAIIVPPVPESTPTSALPASALVEADLLQAEIAGLSTYDAADGGTWVLGEVVNYGPQAIELVQVGVSLLSATGDALSSQVVWVTPATIPSQGRAPFGVLFAEVDQPEATAEAEVLTVRPVFDLGNRTLDLAVVEAEVTIGPSPIRVAGQVENQGQLPAGLVSIVTTFHDDQGLVTGFHEFELNESIQPGERRSFTFMSLPPGGGAESYAFAVQATVLP